MYHEIFDGQEQLPYHIFLIDAETELSHNHPEMEICFLLYGNAEFEIQDKIYPLYEHDFMIVQPLISHRVYSCSADCRMLQLHIELLAFGKYIPALSHTSFLFNNAINNRTQELYKNLYQRLRNILKFALADTNTWRLEVLSEIVGILKILFDHYYTPSDLKIKSFSVQNNQKRMFLILDYINQHWSEPLTLTALGKEMNLNPSYLSRYFKKYMGIGFLDYLTQLRLRHSLDLLLFTEMPIIDVALECGFNDYKTYSRLFKKRYGDNPQGYRKIHKFQMNAKPDHFSQSDSLPLDYAHTLQQQPTELLGQLSLPSAESIATKELLVPLQLNLNTRTQQMLDNHWNRTFTVGSAARILRSKIQKHILYAQLHLQPHYIRFSGLFSEEMHLFAEENGKVYYNWEYLDEIFDFLNQNHLKPFLVLDTMPDALSSRNPKKQTFKINCSLAGQTFIPKSTERFLELIQALIQHYIHRYSASDLLEDCRIQLWSLPELPDSHWNGTEEQFFNLVKQTYHTLRQILPNAYLCAPATIGWQNFSMLRRFLKFCREEQLHFDFYCLNSYGFTSPLNTVYPAVFTPYEKSFSYSDGDSLLNQSADQFKKILSEEKITAPIMVTEWGLNPYDRDLSRDTSFMAAWITEHILHLSPNISEICYCMLTDYFSYSSETSGYEFIGGQGLLTHTGIPKPSFSALEMLAVLGNEILSFGKDYILTKIDNSWRLLIYNYSYYSKDYLNGKQELLFEEDRYNIYQSTLTKNFQIQLSLPTGTYRIETAQIDQEHCAPYEEWLKMGKPERLNAFYHNYLMNKCFPYLHVETIYASDLLHIQRSVPAHGIAIVKIDPI